MFPHPFLLCCTGPQRLRIPFEELCSWYFQVKKTAQKLAHALQEGASAGDFQSRRESSPRGNDSQRKAPEEQPGVRGGQARVSTRSHYPSYQQAIPTASHVSSPPLAGRRADTPYPMVPTPRSTDLPPPDTLYFTMGIREQSGVRRRRNAIFQRSNRP